MIGIQPSVFEIQMFFFPLNLKTLTASCLAHKITKPSEHIN